MSHCAEDDVKRLIASRRRPITSCLEDNRMTTKPQKTRSEIEEMIFWELKARHPALEMIRLHRDGETGWRCDLIWKIEGNAPDVDDVTSLRREADMELAKLRERFEIVED
jgi:hypothetical protein